jgi:hypothetical protein
MPIHVARHAIDHHTPSAISISRRCCAFFNEAHLLSRKKSERRRDSVMAVSWRREAGRRFGSQSAPELGGMTRKQVAVLVGVAEKPVQQLGLPGVLERLIRQRVHRAAVA